MTSRDIHRPPPPRWYPHSVTRSPQVNPFCIMDNTFASNSSPAQSDAGHTPEHQGFSAVHRLSASQERKLVDYLEDHLLDLTRNYKKRCVLRLPTNRYLPLTALQRAPVFYAPNTGLLSQRRTSPPRAHPPDPTGGTLRITAHVSAPSIYRRSLELHHWLQARRRHAPAAA